jgi:hypothetical protein
LAFSLVACGPASTSNSAATYKRFDPAIPFHHGQLFIITPSRSEEAPYASPKERVYVVATHAVPRKHSDFRSPGY